MASYGYTFKNFAGDLWRVAVLDTTEEGAPELLPLKPTEDGFNLGWEGGTDAETYSEILTSTLNFSVYRNTNSLNMLDDLAYGDVNRYEIVLYKVTGEYSETETLYWGGRPLLDSLIKLDMPDNVGVINIQAVDGFGQLQDIEYTGYDPDNLDTTHTLVEWLATIFEKMPITYFTAPVLRTASVWYERRHTPGNTYDPIEKTALKEADFVTMDKYGQIKGMPLYDILIYILTTFNLTIRFWKDFLIIQDNTYEQDTTRSWLYSGTGVYSTTEIINLFQTMPKREGGDFSYIAPIKRVIATYEYGEGIYKKNLFPPVVERDTEYNLGLATTDATLSIGGTIQTDFAGDGDLYRIRCAYKLIITDGTNYLNGTLADNEWTTNPAHYVVVYSRGFKSNSEAAIYTSFWIDTIPPQDGVNITFQWQFDNLVNESDYTVWTPGVGTTQTMTHVAVENSFKVTVTITGAEPMEGEYIYQATVVETEKYDLELRKTIIGDGPKATCKGALRVHDDPVAIADGWNIYSEIGSVTPMDVNSLRCREMLALRRIVTSRMNGKFYGTPDIQKGFVYNTEHYIFTSVNWNAQKNEANFSALALIYT